MNVTIIMPFSRAHNAEAIKASFVSACDGFNGKARLIAVCSDEAHVGLFDESVLTFLPPGLDWCYFKCNQALENLQPSSPEDYFGFVCDDDLYEPGFFASLEQLIGASRPRVIVVNMKRWFHEVAVRDELSAWPDSMRVGLVGLEQFYIRGDIMGRWRFNQNVSHGDGDLMARLHAEMPHDFVFFRHLFVHWNKLPA